MKGWYVIPTTDEPIECKTKSEAVKIGKDLYFKGDFDIYITPFDDDNPNGYFSNSKIILIGNLVGWR